MALIAAFAPERKLRCVQVGANDEKIDDSLYDVSRQFTDRTKLLLVETQVQLIPSLMDNLAFHPDCQIEQVTIGNAGSLTLYGVREQFWRDLDVPYAKDWPLYRAPSGIVSGDREHMARWLTKYMRDPSRVEDAIERFDVESVALASLVEGWSEDGSVDVLQIDTEGYDDHVIMNCDLARLRPSLIFFEVMHLTQSRQEKLFEFLAGSGFTLRRQGENVIALCVGSSGR